MFIYLNISFIFNSITKKNIYQRHNQMFTIRISISLMYNYFYEYMYILISKCKLSILFIYLIIILDIFKLSLVEKSCLCVLSTQLI